MQANRGRQCRPGDYPEPSAVITPVHGHTSSISHGGICYLLARQETASGDEVDCKVEDCTRYGSGDEVNRPQTLGCEALMYGSTGGHCRKGNISNSEAAEVNGKQGVEYQPDQCPD